MRPNFMRPKIRRLEAEAEAIDVVKP